MWINPQNLQVFKLHQEIRQAFPGTSFPVAMGESDIAFVGVEPVRQIPRPNFNPLTEKVVEGAPTKQQARNADGTFTADDPQTETNDAWEWVQKWEVVALTAAEQQAAATAMIAACDAALTAHLDATAQTRRYDNRITCAVRAGYPGPFQAEGQAFALWMDECNALAYQFLAEIQAGTRPMPTDPRQLIELLPAMTWPT